MIYFVHCRAQASPSLIDANVLPLTFLYYESVSNLMHDVNNNNTPLNILKFFQKLSVVHSYNTRSSTSEKFYVQSSRLEIQKRSFSRFGVKLWNEIPQRNKASPSKAYRRELRGILFKILINEIDYIETSTIVKKSGISQTAPFFFLSYFFLYVLLSSVVHIFCSLRRLFIFFHLYRSSGFLCIYTHP